MRRAGEWELSRPKAVHRLNTAGSGVPSNPPMSWQIHVLAWCSKRFAERFDGDSTHRWMPTATLLSLQTTNRDLVVTHAARLTKCHDRPTPREQIAREIPGKPGAVPAI